MLTLLEYILLVEDRLDAIKAKFPALTFQHDTRIAPEWRDHYEAHGAGDDFEGAHKTFSAKLIDRIAEHDPTPKKKYTQWMVQKYHSKQYRMEDLSRIGKAVANFETYKGQLENKDINSYKHVSDVEDATARFSNGGPTSKRQEKKAIRHEGAEEIYQDDKLAVHKMLTKEAACQYGAGTKWCTAARENNMFDEYNDEGPLHVIHDKENNRKYQFHAVSNQFMDEKDRPVDEETIRDLWYGHPPLRNIPDFHPFAAMAGDKDMLKELVANPKLNPLAHGEIAKAADGETKHALLTNHKKIEPYALRQLANYASEKNANLIMDKHLDNLNVIDRHAVMQNLVNPKTPPKIIDRLLKDFPAKDRSDLVDANIIANGTDAHRDHIMKERIQAGIHRDSSLMAMAQHGNEKHLDQLLDQDVMHPVMATHFAKRGTDAQVAKLLVNHPKSVTELSAHDLLNREGAMSAPIRDFLMQHPAGMKQSVMTRIAETGTDDHRIRLSKMASPSSGAMVAIAQHGPDEARTHLLHRMGDEIGGVVMDEINKFGNQDHRKTLLDITQKNMNTAAKAHGVGSHRYLAWAELHNKYRLDYSFHSNPIQSNRAKALAQANLKKNSQEHADLKSALARLK